MHIRVRGRYREPMTVSTVGRPAIRAEATQEAEPRARRRLERTPASKEYINDHALSISLPSLFTSCTYNLKQGSLYPCVIDQSSQATAPR